MPIPYTKIEDLPSAVRAVLPEFGQKVFMGIFNTLALAGVPEETCFYSAWDSMWYVGLHRKPDGSYEQCAMPVMKAGRVISAANMDKIVAAIQALQTTLPLLEELASANGDVGVVKNKKLGDLPKGVHKKSDDGWSLSIPIAKTEPDQMMVFGWLSVAALEDGTPVVDLEGDVIAIEDLERAVYEYMLMSQQAGEMHEKTWDVGRVIESVIFTKEKMEAMGIPEGTLPYGWWIGYKIADPDVWAKIKDGTYSMFSIGGSAIRTPVDG